VLLESLNLEGERLAEDRFLVGYGFGVRSRSRVGTIDLSFAIGETFSLQQTKIHVLLEQNF
jgi:outer membrane translocation and assembly module TamA